LRAEIEAQLAREGARPVTNTGRFRV
jgi:hypothetical protein